MHPNWGFRDIQYKRERAVGIGNLASIGNIRIPVYITIELAEKPVPVIVVVLFTLPVSGVALTAGNTVKFVEARVPEVFRASIR